MIDEAEIHVIAKSKVQCESRCDFPVVLRIKSKLLRAFTQVEAGITARKDDSTNDTDAIEVSSSASSRAGYCGTGNRTRQDLGRAKSLRELAGVNCDLIGVEVEVILRRRVE